jgi:Na+/citrate or Na+/malate symporter
LFPPPQLFFARAALLDLATQNARAIGYYKFVIALLIVGALLATPQRTLVREVVAQNRFAAAFCVIFFAGLFLGLALIDVLYCAPDLAR